MLGEDLDTASVGCYPRATARQADSREELEFKFLNKYKENNLANWDYVIV